MSLWRKKKTLICWEDFKLKKLRRFYSSWTTWRFRTTTTKLNKKYIKKKSHSPQNIFRFIYKHIYEEKKWKINSMSCGMRYRRRQNVIIPLFFSTVYFSLFPFLLYLYTHFLLFLLLSITSKSFPHNHSGLYTIIYNQ